MIRAQRSLAFGAAFLLSLLLAAPAFGAEGGEGLYGKANDNVVTNFGGGDGRGLAFYSRVGRRPNEQVTEGALGIWLPGQGFLLSFTRAGLDEEIEAGPVHYHCTLPLLLWELRFEGAGRLFERAEHV